MLDVVNPLQNTSYTNKDFISIYNELLDLVKELTSQWDPSISNESDPGVILLKLNAIIGDKLSYNSDTNVLELFPLSVTQEKNARQLFEQLGYFMHWYRAATTDVTISWIGEKDSDTEYTIPAFTMVSDLNDTVNYTLIGPVDESSFNTYKVESQKLKLDGSTTTFKAIQGVPVTYDVNGETLITVRNLDSNNRLYFPTVDVAENGVFITNVNTNNYTDWKKVDNLLVQTVSPDSLFYKFGVTQDTSTCYVEFPENAEQLFKSGINITYIKTLGTLGNIAYRTIEKFYNEISPAEDSSVTFTTDNIRMLNYSSATNGEDPQSINDAYRGYKSTIGVFETLVTLRDYISYILTSGLVSNCFVCDRTNDIQCTYKVMTESNDIDNLVTMVDYKNNSPMLSAFDLKLYLLQLPTTLMTTASAYNSTFNMLNSSSQENIKKYIEDIKCISHDYSDILPITSTRSHFCYFKNKYPITCRIIPQYQLTTVAANEVIKNVNQALYNALNAQEIDFGEEIPSELIYGIITGADDRIKSIVLNNIEYTTYAVCYSDTIKQFFEVEISSEDSNPISVSTNRNAQFEYTVDEAVFTEKMGIGNYSAIRFVYNGQPNVEEWQTVGGETVQLDEYGITVTGTVNNNDYMILNISMKTQIRDEILTKSILAGTTQFLVKDETYDYKLDQYYDKVPSEICSRIKAISTNTYINLSVDVDDSTVLNNTTYTLRDNESIQLFSPNIIDSTAYSTYVKFEYKLNNQLLDGEDYRLDANEYFIFYWKEDQNSDYYKYAVYGEGNIIRLTAFDLPANDGDSNVGRSLTPYCTFNIGTESNPAYYTSDEFDNRMTYPISLDVANIKNPVNILSTTKKVTIRKINQIELTAADSYCYWILNDKVQDLDGQEKYRLFEVGEETRLLNSGEYFIYTNSALTNLTILGSGTLLRRTDSTYAWEVDVKDAATIIENGVSAFTEAEWFKITPSDSTLTLIEQHYVNVGPGSQFKVDLVRNREDYLSTTVTTTGSFTATVNDEIFLNKTSGYGDYVFTYSSSNESWLLGTEAVNISDYGITLSAIPEDGDTVVVSVGGYLITLYNDGIVLNNDFEEKITLKDFDVAYKAPGSPSFTKVPVMNISSDIFSWNARTLLALNISKVKEQVLLSGQDISCELKNLYFSNTPISSDSATHVRFFVEEEQYAFEYTSPIEYIVFDGDSEILYVNGDITNYTENFVPPQGAVVVDVDLFDTIDITGSNLNTTDMIYPVTLMSSFDLIMDGGQRMSTYQLNEELELEYLSLYVHGKQINKVPEVHYNSSGDINVEFIAGADSGYQREVLFDLPVGEYILPVYIGTDDLTDTTIYPQGLRISYSTGGASTYLHTINDVEEIDFREKRKYYVYLNVTETGGNSSLILTVPSTITRNLIITIYNIYKYHYKKELSDFQAYKILNLMRIYDRDNLFNYTYKTDDGVEISDPLAGSSFFLSSHIYNKFTIPQMLTNTNIVVAGKR